MKLCRFASDEGPRFGRVVEDEGVVLPLVGDPFGDFRELGGPLRLADVELLPPVVPGTFFCAGLNYAKHIDHAKDKGYQAAKVPERPDIGYRANNALIGHGATILKPADVEGRFEYEAELVAVIGRRLRRASREEAAASVFGWTTGNDVSARAWQHADRTFWRAKNADTFKPMGPWIDTLAEPMGGETEVRINGETRSRFRTGAMIFDAVDFIAEITRYVTIEPGDVIWLGTDGVGQLTPGDVCEIRIDGLSPLSNPVALETV
jgi:2-keto-4-pentenoate hydratase/2-oxohepta-3-ene-1,7-dioic acid hydratase in catechol pathway